MALLVDNAALLDVPESPLAPVADRPAPETGIKPLEIGLLNNMSDTAMHATERQFIRLLGTAAGQQQVRLRCYSLPGIPRSADARLRIETTYENFDALWNTKLDGLIVTGAEPKATTLPQEAYWNELSDVVAWARDNTVSTIWSCLAAHAAVLHLDGIERRRLREKCSGVFACEQVEADELTHGLRWPLRIFHSRYNDIAEADLASHGYRVLTKAENAGVDIFMKQYRSRFVFFQGHPEYDPLSLQREYLRDVGRYLTREQPNYPAVPMDYFDADTTSLLEAFRLRALARRDPALSAECRDILDCASVNADRRGAAGTIFRNWLASLAEIRQGQLRASSAPG